MRSVWKPIYVSYKLYKYNKQFFFNTKYNIAENNIIMNERNDTILPKFLNMQFNVYNGKNYKTIKVVPSMFYHKFGEFFMTRKRAIFKPKLKKK